MKKVRILIADDHEVVRHGLRRLLEAQRGWKVCGEASTGREAVESTRELKPDVVVLDISMPELDGIEATRQIRKALPETEVVALTMHEPEQLLRDVLEAGARGFVLKSDAGHDLVAAVSALAAHKPFLSSTVLEALTISYLQDGLSSEKVKRSRMRLTSREHQIAQLLAEGKSNKEVAAALEISVRTVETHRMNIMRKLNLHSVSDLVRYSIRQKMISP